MDKLTNNKVTIHVAEQETTQQKQPTQQAINKAAPTESSSQSSQSAEQSAAAYEMFTQGAANGGAATKKRNLEETEESVESASQEKQVETKEPPKVETQGIASTELTDEQLAMISNIQKTVMNNVMMNVENIVKVLNMKLADDDTRKLVLSDIAQRISALNFNTDEQLLFELLTKMTTGVCMAAWPTILPQIAPNAPALLPNADDPNKDRLMEIASEVVQGVVKYAIHEQIRDLLALHNTVNPHYIEVIRKAQSKEQLLNAQGALVIQINLLPLNDIKILRNLLDPSITETQSFQELSEQGQRVFDNITEFYSTLSEGDRSLASDAILVGIKDKLSKN